MPPAVKKPLDHRSKVFTWTTEDGVNIEIPLRIKMRVLRSIGVGRDLDAGAMFDMLDAIMPGQSDVLDDMDVADFQACFTAWQTAYQGQTGATLGESSDSST